MPKKFAFNLFKKREEPFPHIELNESQNSLTPLIQKNKSEVPAIPLNIKILTCESKENLLSTLEKYNNDSPIKELDLSSVSNLVDVKTLELIKDFTSLQTIDLRGRNKINDNQILQHLSALPRLKNFYTPSCPRTVSNEEFKEQKENRNPNSISINTILEFSIRGPETIYKESDLALFDPELQMRETVYGKQYGDDDEIFTNPQYNNYDENFPTVIFHLEPSSKISNSNAQSVSSNSGNKGAEFEI